MSNYTGAVPDTRRPTDWRNAAACANEDPALFFPTGDSGPNLLTIEQAKAVCNRCPVLDTCGRWAADNRIEYGIFGGLTEQERASLHRAAVRRRLSPEQAAAKAEQKRQPEKPRTLRSIFDENTVRLYDGHLGWNGPQKIHFKGEVFTPKQLAFFLDRGRMPDGPVRPECSSTDCILPAHLADTAERSGCGTRLGYRRHLSAAETPCGPCKRANADADNQLRWTGTTKAVAS